MKEGSGIILKNQTRGTVGSYHFMVRFGFPDGEEQNMLLWFVVLSPAEQVQQQQASNALLLATCLSALPRRTSSELMFSYGEKKTTEF